MASWENAPPALLTRAFRAWDVFQLTGRYFRGRDVPESRCTYRVNGVACELGGQNVLSMLLEIVAKDVYGLRRLRGIKTVVDVGANIGIFSAHACTLFPRARIVAYEPCSISLTQLRRNLRDLAVAVQPFAVGQVSSKTFLHIADDLTACRIAAEGENGPKESCEMVSLDAVIKHLGCPIDLLKLDCEGSEYEILRTEGLGAVTYLAGELHSCPKGTPTQGLELLQRRGFRVEKWAPFPDGKAGIVWASRLNRSQE